MIYSKNTKGKQNLIFKKAAVFFVILLTLPAGIILNSNNSTPAAGKSLAEKQQQINTSDTVILKENDEGDEVKKLQKKLYNIGYDITIDGKFGVETIETVKKFQADSVMEQTGVYSKTTEDALYKKTETRNYDEIEAAQQKKLQEQYFLSLEDKIKSFLGDELNNVGFIYYDINTGHKISINENKVCVAASTYKVGMNMVAYDWVRSGSLSLSEELFYSSEYFESGTGILQDQIDTTLKSSITVQKLLDLSIMYSDNIATNMITSRLGGFTAVCNTVSNITGITDVDMSSNTITPEMEFRLLKRLYDDKDEQFNAHLISTMKQTIFHDRIDKYLPQELVAHKVGNYGTYTNDVGIIFTDKPYIFVMYVDGTSDASSLIADLSKMLYEEQLNIPSF